MNSLPPGELPLRERIHDDGHWRVVHALTSSLAGWLCVVSRRHVASMSELSPDEAAALGPLLQRLSSAIEEATRAPKCYVMFYAEAPGFEHLHIHVAPRLPDCPEDRLGPKLISYLGEPEERWLTSEQMDEVSGRIQHQLLQTTRPTDRRSTKRRRA